jgi:hypothetical protein
MWLAGPFPGFTLFIAQPRSGEADEVAVLICIIAGCSCLGGGIVAGRCSKLIPNNRVNPDRYIVQNINTAFRRIQ